MKTTDWNASRFFRGLTAMSPLAKENGFTFCQVSGLEGFEEALQKLQSHTAFVCVSNLSEGFIELDNTPHSRKVKTVFLAMRHAIDDMDARQECMEIMQELFRQYMSVLVLEKTRLQEESIYLDSRIKFSEIDEYFFSGCACAFFQIAFDIYTDLVFNPNDWDGQAFDEEFTQHYA